MIKFINRPWAQGSKFQWWKGKDAETMVSAHMVLYKALENKALFFLGKMHSVKTKSSSGPWSWFRCERDARAETENASKTQGEHEADTPQFDFQCVCLQGVKNGSVYKPRWPGPPDRLVCIFLFVAGQKKEDPHPHSNPPLSGGLKIPGSSYETHIKH